jgi:PAS domain S-box-containing protein
MLVQIADAGIHRENNREKKWAKPELSWRYILLAVVMSALYYTSAHIGLKLASVSGAAAYVWPPTGIAIAFTILFGFGVWPAIFVPAVLVNYFIGIPLSSSLLIGFGNTSEALLAVLWLNKYFSFRPTLDRRMDVLSYLLVASILAPVVSATVGTSALWISGHASNHTFLATWMTWWYGDFLGALVIGPLFLVWSVPGRDKTNPVRSIEAGLLMFVLVTVSLLVTGGVRHSFEHDPTIHILFPVLIWAALRFGVKGTVTCIFVVSTILIHYTAHGMGPFAFASLGTSLFTALNFLGILSLTSLLLAAAVCEQRRAQKAFQVSRQEVQFSLDRERQAFGEIEHQRQRLETFFMQAPALITMLSGHELKYELVNPEAAEFHRRFYGVDNVQGRRVREIHNGPYGERVIELMERVLRTGETIINREYPMIRVDSNGVRQEYYFTGTIQPFFGRNGKITGIINFANDVTAEVLARRNQKSMESALQESEREFRTMFDVAPVGMVQVNPNGKFLRVNEAFCNITGYSRFELAQMTFAELTHPEDHPGDSRQFAELLQSAKSLLRHEKRYIRKDGKVIWVSLNAAWLTDSDGKPLRTVAYVEDITDRKSRELSDQNARKTAEAASHAKSHFLAAMSHEIRTPLGAILGFAEVLKDLELSPGERLRYIDIISRNGRELSRLIDDILDLSKVEAGRMAVQKNATSLTPLVGDVITLLSQKARAKNLRLVLSHDTLVPDLIYTDATRLRQILINIIGNAIKFSERGDVVVSMRPGPENRSVQFMVKDNGPGISAEGQRILFQQFSQTESARGYGGTGLGLYLSKRLALALGGNIELLESSPQTGTTFLITIATGIENETQSVDELKVMCSTAHDIKGKNILLVDDSDDNRTLVEHLLTKSGAKVKAVGNGLEAVELTDTNSFDVVLMDLQMPVLDGFAATREIRKRGYQGPILALSAHAMKEVREQCIETGFDDHIAKPIVTGELIHKISHCIEHRGWYH